MKRRSLRASVTIWSLIPMFVFGVLVLTLSIAWSWRDVRNVVNERNEKLAQMSAIALVGYLNGDAPERSQICAALEALAEHSTGTIYVINETGYVLCAPKGARFSSGSILRGDLLALVVGKRTGSLSAVSPENPHIASTAPIPGTSWNILVEESRSEIFASTTSFLVAMGALLFAVLIFAALLLWFGLQRIVEPLVAVTNQAGRVAAADEFTPPNVSGPAEVEALVAAFNHMVTQLRRQRDTLQEYASRVLRSQEEERKRISRDLHDETAQELVGLMQRIDLCRLSAEENPKLIAALDELGELASDALLGVRRMSRDLRPLILEDLGLVAALQTIAEDLESQLEENARVSCEVIGDERRLPPETELTAFRIVQEALTNVRKHALSATRVYVTVQFQEHNLVVRVEDNGPGFKLVPSVLGADTEHLGLMGMKERAELLNGEFSLHSQPGEGTQVILRLPLE
ncbi:MAG: HAMP domain-containing protein [Anaerolineae bacterium]|nr:HAMP domain-containing protein [Anaerolineae bacterium]